MIDQKLNGEYDAKILFYEMFFIISRCQQSAAFWLKPNEPFIQIDKLHKRIFVHFRKTH